VETATAESGGLLRRLHGRGRIESNGLAPVGPDLATIDALTNPDDCRCSSPTSTASASRVFRLSADGPEQCDER